EKVYWALIAGAPRAASGVIDQPLIKGSSRGGERMVIAGGAEGDPARTRYQVLERFREWSWVAAYPDTGRTHQIRVHMAHIGHPLLGDPLYARPFHPPATWPETCRTVIETFRHQALHAQELTIIHPTRLESMTFRADPPEAFQNLLAALRQVEKKINWL
ncbi:MAG: RNA pseudouridine synthase, partial [Magnetococcales bacterium]|nr:RNA pseudouridine synthase [Magnetococcales bacterium]